MNKDARLLVKRDAIPAFFDKNSVWVGEWGVFSNHDEISNDWMHKKHFIFPFLGIHTLENHANRWNNADTVFTRYLSIDGRHWFGGKDKFENLVGYLFICPAGEQLKRFATSCFLPEFPEY